ncbi:MAG: hypothetical protein MSB11_02380 [Prevotella sp.]|nr:hypothetical protein [Prevotella sp.]
MKKLFTFICVVASLCLTSCISDSDNNTRTFATYFTISGYEPNYVLYSDDGMVTVKLNPSTLPSDKGLAKNKRGYFYIQYNTENVQTGADKKSVINNASIIGGQYIAVNNVMSKVEADLNKVTNPDSIFEMSGMATPWYAHGYVTMQVKSSYFVGTDGKYILPTHNVVLDTDADVKDNAIKYTIYCNRHPQKNTQVYGPSTFNVCFLARDLMMVPGSDSITVTVAGKGCKDVSFKVGRNSLYN